MGERVDPHPDLRQELARRIDLLRPRLVEAVVDAVRIPSVNPTFPGQDYEETVGGEGQVARFMADLYSSAGGDVDVFGKQQGRENAVGIWNGSGGGRSLIYNGHVDVVPPGPSEAWTGGSPWSGRVESGRVWGRGACDMKGGLVAQAFALIALAEAGVRLQGDLVLEAVVGEEMMEHELGTTACCERGYLADAAVVSEPSGPPASLAVVPVTSGILSFTLSVEGKATHAALRGETIRAGGYGATVGVSAIDRIAPLYDGLRELEREWEQTKRHPLFRPGHFAIYPGVIVGGPRSGLVPFFIADHARIEYVVIYHPDETVEHVKAEIERRVFETAAEDPWLVEHPPRVEWIHHWPRSSIAGDHPIVAATADAFTAATGRAATIHGFAAVADTTFLSAAGVPAIVCGPGDLRMAHAVDESVEIDDLVVAAKTYALLAAAWCGT